MLFCLAGCQMQYKPLFNENVALDYCYSQVNRALKDLVDSNGTYNYSMMPRNILPGDTTWNCRQASSQEWCSGFWPGILWMTYDYTKDKDIKKVAKGYTDALRFLSSQPIYDHDIGFITINSLMKGYEATGREDYKKCALAAADSLATLYNSHVGTILSWPRHVKDYGGHNTIMDNIMNLELLFWAAKNGGDKRLYDIAVSHSDTTMRYQFRPDGSCYHVAVYDTLTGNFIKGVTHQGYSDSSMWSRGQAWAIYGYTMVYRFTHEQRFLEHAKKVADRIDKKYGDDIQTITSVMEMGQMAKMLNMLQASTWAISLLAIIIGGLGIINTMLMSVFERTREIGVLKAVGWSNTKILTMIIGESLVITIVSAIIGSIVGYSTCLILAPKMQITPLFTPKIFIQSFLVAIIVGIIGGLYPAIKAIKLPPTEALRYE